MNSPRLITSLPNTIWDKMHSIANKKGLSVSALARVFIIEKLESIPAEDSAKNSPGGMLRV